MINAAAENVRNLNETPLNIPASGGRAHEFTTENDGRRQEMCDLEQEIHKLKETRNKILRCFGKFKKD